MSSGESSPPPAPTLPIHAVRLDADGHELIVKRRPGRPRKVFAAPVFSSTEAEYNRAVSAARDRHVSSDPLVGAIAAKAGANDVLQGVLRALATETAAIAYEIQQGQRAGKDTSQLASRRIDGLVKICAVELGRCKLGLGAELTHDHPKMPLIVSFFLSTVRGVLESTLSSTIGSQVNDVIEQRLRRWQENGDE